jgi:predicted dehydrogenase
MTTSVRVGMVGTGFVASLHARAYGRLGEARARIVAVAGRDPDRRAAFASRYGIAAECEDFEAMLRRSDVDVVDLCVPNSLHAPFTIAAAEASKHVICEKPLTGYFGGPGAEHPVGRTPKRLMRQEAVRSAEAMIEAATRNGVRVMYGENWVYSPPIRRTLELALASGGTILEMRAQECHSGSHAAYAKEWDKAGGGALLRLGVHPLSGALYFKQQEGLARDGQPIAAKSVLADTADFGQVRSFRDSDRARFAQGWLDVETWASVIVSFDDGTRATVFSSDYVLGGMEDTLELYLSNCRVNCDLMHNTTLRAYAPDRAVLGSEYLAEKLETNAGWSYPAVDEEWLLGYPQEIEDFVGAVAEDRDPACDARFGLEVCKVVYAAYQSAEEGRRIEI